MASKLVGPEERRLTGASAARPSAQMWISEAAPWPRGTCSHRVPPSAPGHRVMPVPRQMDSKNSIVPLSHSCRSLLVFDGFYYLVANANPLLFSFQTLSYPVPPSLYVPISLGVSQSQQHVRITWGGGSAAENKN